MKKFTIVDTRINSTKTISGENLVTLGDLKKALRENGIETNGMTIQEGLTKTEFTTDDALLPHDVPYKGGTTDNLVFRLTQAEKKIRSGATMSRAEAFAEVRRLNLQAAIVDKYGRNYTQVRTEDLVAEIEAANGNTDVAEAPVEDCNVADAVALLTQKLIDNACISSEEGEEVMGLLGKQCKKEDEIYSSSEIEDMFKNM